MYVFMLVSYSFRKLLLHKVVNMDRPVRLSMLSKIVSLELTYSKSKIINKSFPGRA